MSLTLEEAQALARQIVKALEQAGAPFLLAIEYDKDDGSAGAVWHSFGNNASAANLSAVLLGGLSKLSERTGCEVCDSALGALELAHAALELRSAGPCH